MSNLEYDNLYKFLVSLGIILIALPVAILIFLFNMEPILISQIEFDSLSTFSLQMVQQREQLTSCFVIVFPWVAIILTLLGLSLLIFGIYKWVDVQKNLDKKLDAETTLQILAVLEMNSKEIAEKIEAETKEDSIESTNVENIPMDSNSSRMEKYIKVEDLCFNYFTKMYGRRYSFKRNIGIGKHKYDFIGVSQRDNVDLIVEIKYWSTAVGIARRLYDFLDNFYDAGINYETIAHRNFRCIAVLITTKDQLPRLESNIETYRQAHRENASKIEIKCFAEEAL